MIRDNSGVNSERTRMSFLFDPNVAYLLLILGFVLSVLALFTPGTGLLEAGALAAIGLTGYAVYYPPVVNWWALLLLAVGVVPFVFAVRKAKKWLWLIPSVVLFIAGGIFLVPQTLDAQSVNPIFAVFMSIVSTGLLWLIGRKTFDAMKAKPVQDLKRLEGQVGEARTEIKNNGTAYVGGEEWSARSETTIHAGSLVKVKGREGLVLLVEPVKKGD
jgi:membrane-bound serine protease (ClpP class)